MKREIIGEVTKNTVDKTKMMKQKIEHTKMIKKKLRKNFFLNYKNLNFKHLLIYLVFSQR